MDFRDAARHALERAKTELASGDFNRLAYAALEIRKTMEAVTYDKAQSYKDEMPTVQYRTWQPGKVIKYLTEIDPHAATGRIVRFGTQVERGKPAEPMQHLGTEHFLTMRNLIKDYNKLGSYLHIPTLAQVEEGNIDDTKIRDHCQHCIDDLEKVLNSTIWNAKSGTYSNIKCLRCGFLMTKKINPNATEPVDAYCIECGAKYTLSKEGVWIAKGQHFKCLTPECEFVMVLFEDEIQVGADWECPECKKTFILSLKVVPKTLDTATSTVDAVR